MLTHYDPIPLHVYTDHGRFYTVNGLQYPGVGNILTATESSQQQEFWQQWKANPENVAYSDKAKSRGKLFHSMIEHHFRAGDRQLAFQDVDDDVIAQVLPYWHSVCNVIQRITDPLLIESAVWHQVGHYAGTVDMVASFDGIPVILDWKTSTKFKKPEYCVRYPLQLAAYCGATNRMYNTKIKHGVIIVALPNTEAQVLQFPLAEYWPLWLNRLKIYWSKQTTPLAEQALRAIQEECFTRKNKCTQLQQVILRPPQSPAQPLLQL